MPRYSLPKLNSITQGSFEPNRKNPISLRDDDNLDDNFKPLKVGDLNSSLFLARNKVQINGDLFLDGDIQSPVNLRYPELNIYPYPITANTEGDNFYIKIQPLTGGYLRAYIGTVDSDGSSWLSHMYIEPDGNLYLEPTNEQIWIPTETKLYFGGNTYIVESADDILDIVVGGDTILKLTETTLNLVEVQDSNLVLDATQRLMFDGNSNEGTYISESSADRLVFVVGTQEMVRISEGTGVGDYIFLNGHISVEATGKLLFDGNGASVLGHTYIVESSDDVLDVVVGADTIFQITESGADGNTIDIENACIGFTQLEPTFDLTTTTVDFRHSNKQNLTFGSGNIINLQLIFPLVSGNFQLLIKQDGTGSRTIANYKVYEFDESTADGYNAIKWAGGSAPTLTTDANHVDILSFYWDADNEIAYGVATLDFQF